MLKKIIGAICSIAIIMSFDISSTASYQETNNERVTLMEYQLQFEEMSNKELNDFIDSIAAQYNSQARTSVVVPTASLRAAWLAAAQIAKNMGYPCAGTLVEKSAMGANYNETNGMFAQKIKTTSAFARWRKNHTETSLIFEKHDNADLFYALHKTSCSFSGNSSGARATVSDIFDFKPEQYGDIFTASVNNWAWLSQQIGALSNIRVAIVIYL